MALLQQPSFGVTGASKLWCWPFGYGKEKPNSNSLCEKVKVTDLIRNEKSNHVLSQLRSMIKNESSGAGLMVYQVKPLPMV